MTFGLDITGAAEDPQQYDQLLMEHEIDDEFLVFVLLQLSFELDKNSPELVGLIAKTPGFDLEQAKRLHLYMCAYYDPPEPDHLDPELWIRPEDFAAAARALAEVFRQGAPLARYLYDLTLAENPDEAEIIDYYLTPDAWSQHAPGDWQAHLALHLSRLADAALAIGKRGEAKIRFDWHE